MDRAITETERRRAIQMAYNAEHGIVPKTIVKAIPDSIEISDKAENARMNTRRMGKLEREAAIDRLTREMKPLIFSPQLPKPGKYQKDSNEWKKLI